jgi:hypothetical protein
VQLDDDDDASGSASDLIRGCPPRVPLDRSFARPIGKRNALVSLACLDCPAQLVRILADLAEAEDGRVQRVVLLEGEPIG